MEKLNKLLSQLEAQISKQENSDQKVSQGNVGWHIEHSLLTINIIIEQLRNSNPHDYKWSFNFPRLLVFTLNKIPRGKAKAPGVVQPKTDYNSNTLKKHLEVTRERVMDLQSVNPDACFDHPFFGNLKFKPTVKFLCIHTQHHLDIINDIIRSRV